MSLLSFHLQYNSCHHKSKLDELQEYFALTRNFVEIFLIYSCLACPKGESKMVEVAIVKDTFADSFTTSWSHVFAISINAHTMPGFDTKMV